MKQSINQILHELSCYSTKEIEELQDKALDRTKEETNEVIRISGIGISGIKIA